MHSIHSLASRAASRTAIAAGLLFALAGAASAFQLQQPVETYQATASNGTHWGAIDGTAPAPGVAPERSAAVFEPMIDAPSDAPPAIVYDGYDRPLTVHRWRHHG